MEAPHPSDGLPFLRPTVPVRPRRRASPLPFPPSACHAANRRCDYGVDIGRGQVLPASPRHLSVCSSLCSVQYTISLGGLHFRDSRSGDPMTELRLSSSAAIPPLLDATVNVQCVLLMFGFYRILSSDPGVVTCGSSHSEGLNQCTSSEVKHQTEDALSFRVRYCQRCSANVIGYDHHCPAFGNCIGQKNHRLFMVLLIGFIINEASYVSCSTWFVRESRNKNQFRLKSGLSMDLATGTLLFSLLQILWQVIFLIWHIYCICFNIKTDEWVNWKKYPEFQVAVQLQPGQHMSGVKFWNPYDRGIVSNIKDFLWSR